jgi:nucleotide-binding universal stress UspA family protein
MPKSKLLVCVNDSEYSRVALRFTCAKAKNAGHPVEILHVIEPTEFQNLFSMEDVMREEKHHTAEELLKKFSDEAYESFGIMPSLMIKEGMVGEEIITAVEEDHTINMLLVGKSPDGNSRGNLIPWLATQLGKNLLIPMLIVPGNLTDQQINELT